MRRRAFIAGLAGAVVPACPLCVSGDFVQAEEWPGRLITMVVPYAAGGPVDTVGRIMAAGLSEKLRQQVVVENASGAGGMTGSSRVAKATPDGYTLLLGGLAVLGLVPNLYKKPLYNPVTDFTPVSLFAEFGPHPDRTQGLPGRQFQGFRCLRAGKSGENAVRFFRRWLWAAHLRRAAQYCHGHYHHACALSRQPAGVARLAGRTHRLHV